MIKDWWRTDVLHCKLQETGYFTEIEYDINGEEDNLVIFYGTLGAIANANLQGSGYIINKDLHRVFHSDLYKILQEYNDSKLPVYEKGILDNEKI